MLAVTDSPIVLIAASRSPKPPPATKANTGKTATLIAPVNAQATLVCLLMTAPRLYVVFSLLSI